MCADGFSARRVARARPAVDGAHRTSTHADGWPVLAGKAMGELICMRVRDDDGDEVLLGEDEWLPARPSDYLIFLLLGAGSSLLIFLGIWKAVDMIASL